MYFDFFFSNQKLCFFLYNKLFMLKL